MPACPYIIHKNELLQTHLLFVHFFVFQH